MVPRHAHDVDKAPRIVCVCVCADGGHRRYEHNVCLRAISLPMITERKSGRRENDDGKTSGNYNVDVESVAPNATKIMVRVLRRKLDN